MSIHRFLPIFILLFPLSLEAQTSLQLNSSEIKLGIKKLNTVGSVLYIAAHPDDENTRLLTYLSKERKLRTESDRAESQLYPNIGHCAML